VLAPLLHAARVPCGPLRQGLSFRFVSFHSFVRSFVQALRAFRAFVSFVSFVSIVSFVACRGPSPATIRGRAGACMGPPARHRGTFIPLTGPHCPTAMTASGLTGVHTTSCSCSARLLFFGGGLDCSALSFLCSEYLLRLMNVLSACDLCCAGA
jgi:hypothetical protein